MANPDNSTVSRTTNITTAADEAETIILKVPFGNDIENCLLDLDGIGSLLLDVAASLDAGSLPSTRSLYFLGVSVRDRARTLADDLGMKMPQRGGEG